MTQYLASPTILTSTLQYLTVNRTFINDLLAINGMTLVMFTVKTWTQDQINIDFNQAVYDKLRIKYENLTDFVEQFKYFSDDLARNKNLYNINPFPDLISKGVYILGKNDSELEIFPDVQLALKCSTGKAWTEDLRKQFYRSIQLAQEVDTKLTNEEKELLQICPVYLYFQTSLDNFFFKNILVMQRIAEGVTLGNTKSGFSEKFCRVFSIPTVEEIRLQPQFTLNLYLDKDEKRQLFKIQTACLFKKLWHKGIKILSLNQKNILISQVRETGQIRYIIIDPVPNFYLPLSPLYNTFTSILCK